MEQHTSLHDEAPQGASFDYSFVDTVGRIALYDDLRSAPRVVEIKPADTAAYIEALASTVYEQSHGAGGIIPYTVIREVSENFIHACFKEVVVSILDKGNTIRFADHGPGIPSKEKAQMPGFSSAVEPMKNYIRGVGSGLPIVREYLESSHGTITIEDNLGTGAVVTVSLVREEDDPLDDWDETDVLGSKGEYAPSSSYASETAAVRSALRSAPHSWRRTLPLQPSRHLSLRGLIQRARSGSLPTRLRAARLQRGTRGPCSRTGSLLRSPLPGISELWSLRRRPNGLSGLRSSTGTSGVSGLPGRRHAGARPLRTRANIPETSP